MGKKLSMVVPDNNADTNEFISILEGHINSYSSNNQNKDVINIGAQPQLGSFLDQDIKRNNDKNKQNFTLSKDLEVNNNHNIENKTTGKLTKL